MRLERRKTRHLSLVVGVVLLGGCSAIKERTQRTISSDPPGATVLASGTKIGTPHLRIVPDDVFPPRFVGRTYRSSGLLSLKKPGCETYTISVNDAVLAKDIHVKLNCDAVPSPSGHSPDEKGQGSVAKRLQTLRMLHEQKLITDDEYKKARERILREL